MFAVPLAAALATCAPGRGDIINIVGDGAHSTEGLGSFTGMLRYEADTFDIVGLLTVELTNTSPAANGGYITGFLFNIASTDSNASATLLSDPAPTHPFEQCLGLGLNASPFGNPFDAGAALGGGFLGSGNAADGIAVGEVGAFAFEVEAADAGSLSAISFLEGGPYDFNFLVRFRGFEDDGSDKVPAMLVPLPAPVYLAAVGLAGVVLLRRRSVT